MRDRDLDLKTNDETIILRHGIDHVYLQVYGPYETSLMLQWSNAVRIRTFIYEIWAKRLHDTML